MPPQRKPSWWEHADLELRLYRSGGFFFLSGHDGTKRIHERLTKNASSENPLQVAVSESDAADIVATINRALGVSNFRAA